MLLLLVSFVLISVQDSKAQHLADHGARTVGTVVSYKASEDFMASPNSMEVGYEVGGQALRARINVGDDSVYQPGQEVVVIYDQDHPKRVRTQEESNEPHALVLITIVSGMVGFLLFVTGVLRLLRKRPVRHGAPGG